ncbi:Protein O-mannosyltransferase 2, partial [Gonapodya sp. JEL0774]
MPKVLCIGSVNVDDVFAVPHIVVSGETLASTHYQVSPGGKGANQSVSLAKAGARTFHAAIIGVDGTFVRDLMEKGGVDVRFLEVDPIQSTGRAIIQHSTTTSDNAIVLFPGTNHAITPEFAQKVLDSTWSSGSNVGRGAVESNQWSREDWVVMQNEISCGGEVMNLAIEQGLVVVFNPAPFVPSILDTFPIDRVQVLVFNEVEFTGFLNAGWDTGVAPSSIDIVNSLTATDSMQTRQLLQNAFIRARGCALLVVTLGHLGVVAGLRRWHSALEDNYELTVLAQPALPDTKLVDTTGAGDTFVGYLVAELMAQPEVVPLETSGGVNRLVIPIDTAKHAIRKATVAAGMACEVAGAMRAAVGGGASQLPYGGYTGDGTTPSRYDVDDNDKTRRRVIVPRDGLVSYVDASGFGKYVAIWNAHEWWAIPAILTLLGFATRLWAISWADFVVWDEAHFGKFASHYIQRQFYFDVHPPLGKILLGFSGVIAGYNGTWDFPSGATYPQELNYGVMRVFCATFGALMVPLAWYTALEMRMGKRAALLAAVMVLWDTSYIAISKFILLDSMLLFFTSSHDLLTFHSSPFTESWWYWLTMTGLSLGCVLSVKWVGLFAVAVVGLVTVEDLWRLLGDSKLSMKKYLYHWIARIACLIVLPISVYMFSFKMHFFILNRSGTGDAQMSSLFQAGLRGIDFDQNPLEVAYGSRITIKNNGPGGGLLHSHIQKYPKGSEQQQVTCYGHKDSNNDWIVAQNWNLVKKSEIDAGIQSNLSVMLPDGNAKPWAGESLKYWEDDKGRKGVPPASETEI